MFKKTNLLKGCVGVIIGIYSFQVLACCQDCAIGLSTSLRTDTLRHLAP